MSSEPKSPIVPQDSQLQEDSVVNSQQDFGLGLLPSSPHCPHTSLKLFLLQLYVSCLAHILWQLCKMEETEGGGQPDSGAAKANSILPMPWMAILENGKPLPARA